MSFLIKCKDYYFVKDNVSFVGFEEGHEPTRTEPGEHDRLVVGLKNREKVFNIHGPKTLLGQFVKQLEDQ